jgi:hypothetical protein
VDGTSMEKLPSKSVVIPIGLDLTVIFTPGMGFPNSSYTVPITICWEKQKELDNKKERLIKYFICLWNKT